MRRLLPYPMLAVGLFGMWLLLTQSVSMAQVLLGAIVAIIASHGMRLLRPDRPQIRSYRPLLRLAPIVFADIIRSNIAVAKIVLFPPRDQVSAFVRLPIALRSEHGLTLLALILTATPGTMWLQFDRVRRVLIVHVLDLVDEEEWIRLIKRRYETLLIEAFDT
ncbi:MAG: Na+/H+ antiporter subunit E [Sphingomonadaceae bacterium]|nr:Na+/H+ antiporter subunit E [Sphingomonadaceae bacterium]